MENDQEHKEKKAPFPLTAAAREPTKSKDNVVVEFDEAWSEMRTGRAGRQIVCYVARNLTKGGQYGVELFEDDKGAPHGWCNCAASVVCKHIKGALEDLLRWQPKFGSQVFAGPEGTPIDLTIKGEQ